MSFVGRTYDRILSTLEVSYSLSLRPYNHDQDLNLSIVIKFNSPQNPENIHRPAEGLRGF